MVENEGQTFVDINASTKSGWKERTEITIQHQNLVTKNAKKYQA